MAITLRSLDLRTKLKDVMSSLKNFIEVHKGKFYFITILYKDHELSTTRKTRIELTILDLGELLQNSHASFICEQI